MELKSFDTLETSGFSNHKYVLKYLKELVYFPNAIIVYRMLLIIQVAVVYVERVFQN